MANANETIKIELATLYTEDVMAQIEEELIIRGMKAEYSHSGTSAITNIPEDKLIDNVRTEELTKDLAKHSICKLCCASGSVMPPPNATGRTSKVSGELPIRLRLVNATAESDEIVEFAAEKGLANHSYQGVHAELFFINKDEDRNKYPNLPTKKYNFKVVKKNTNGVERETSKPVEICYRLFFSIVLKFEITIEVIAECLRKIAQNNRTTYTLRGLCKEYSKTQEFVTDFDAARKLPIKEVQEKSAFLATPALFRKLKSRTPHNADQVLFFTDYLDNETYDIPAAIQQAVENHIGSSRGRKQY